MAGESKFTEEVWTTWLEPFRAVQLLIDVGLEDREHSVSWLKARLRSGELRAGGWHLDLSGGPASEPSLVSGRYKVSTWGQIAAIAWKDDFWISGDYQPVGDEVDLSGIRYAPRLYAAPTFPHDLISVRFDPAPIIAFCERAAPAIAVPTQAPTSTTTGSRRGARRKDWWDQLWIEMIRRIMKGTLLPKNQAELQGILEDHVINELGQEVGDSTLKPMAANLFKFLDERSGEIGENSKP